MAAKSLDNLFCSSEQPNCPICADICVNPVTLQCQHKFCGICLNKYCESVDCDPLQQLMQCPVCRQKSTWIEQLTTRGSQNDLSFSTPGSMHEMAELLESPKPVVCDVCRYKKCESFACEHCPVCAINLCDSCKLKHDRHEPFRTHAAVPVSRRDRSAMKCEQHEAEFVRYYCAACIAPLCAVCAVVDHVGHPTTELTMALGGKREAIDSAIHNMSEQVIRYEEVLAQLEDVCSVREAAVKKTRMEIERHAASIIAAVHRRRQELLDDLDSRDVAGKKAIDIERENYSTQLASMKSLWKFAAKLTEPGQSLQLLAMYGDLKKMVDSTVNTLEPHLPRDATLMTMFVPKEQLTIGELQSCEISVDLLRRVSSAAGDSGIESPRATSPTPPSASSNSFGSIKRWQTPRLLWKADKIGQRSGEINEPYGVAITSDGTVIVAEWLNQRLQVFDSTGYSRDIVGLGQIQPWGVAIIQNGLVALTDEKEHTVKVYNYNNGSVVTSWKKAMFGWPRGIAINSAGHVVVSDTQHTKHTVSIHLPDGQRVHEFGSQGSGNCQFHWPRYVTVDQQHGDRIIVSDGSNHCVKVFDATGQFQLKFGSLGTSDGRLKHPRGVAVDAQGEIIVADQDNNRLSLFTADGRFVRHIISIHRPWGVALNESGLLAVTHKQSVSVYKVF